MKLKLAAAAALVALSGAANAAIDNGNSTATAGNGELFFSVWDANSSYTRDLNVTINSFESEVAAVGDYLKSVSADALFTSFLSTADLSSVKWAISAVDNIGARRIIETYSALPAVYSTADLIRTAAGNLSSFVSNLNANGTATAESAIYAVGNSGYAGNTDPKTGLYNLTNALVGFNRAGTAANDSYETGLNLVRIGAAATGIAVGSYTPYADNGSALRAYLDLNQGSATFGQLTIAAPVPEPESYAMLLAGLGVMGAIARRRRNKQA